MKLLTIIAKSMTLRGIIGAVAAGAVVYASFGDYPRVAWFAVPIGALSGALACIVADTIIEAMFKAVMIFTLLFLTLPLLPKARLEEAPWWKIAWFSMIGALVGHAVGSVLGGLCRIVYEPPIGISQDQDKPDA